jgi:ATP-dependent Clp protease adaptor protein ClpS
MSENDQNQDDNGLGDAAGVIAERKVVAKRPSLYKVLLLNDDFTPMEFVVTILEKFFNKTHQAATEVMLSVHNKGSGLCGIYPYEVAETKVALVTEYAREHEHPLQCTMEKA